MKLAFLSDIHSNIFALKAAMRALKSFNPSQVYCLGDIVGPLPFTTETLGEIKKNRIISIAGNYDLAVAYDKEKCGSRFKTIVDEKLAREYFRITKRAINDSDKSSLAQLKTKLVISESGNNKRFLLFHGTPDDPSVYLEDGPNEDLFLRIIDRTKANLYFFGHGHQPYIKKVKDKIFVNCGSVGKSQEPGFADYVTVESSGEGLSIQIMRACYDLKEMKTAFKKSKYPEEIINTWY